MSRSNPAPQESLDCFVARAPRNDGGAPDAAIPRADKRFLDLPCHKLPRWTIQFNRCPRCNAASGIARGESRNGYARECPNCNVLIFFESESHDEHIKRALKAAHRMRRALIAAEGEKPSTEGTPSYVRTS
jgi:hypothetical protein